MRHDPQTLYQIGHLYQLMSDVDQAAEWCVNKFSPLSTTAPADFLRIFFARNLSYKLVFLGFRFNQLLGIVPSDPGVLQKLGEMYDHLGDKQQAYQYYSDVRLALLDFSKFYSRKEQKSLGTFQSIFSAVLQILSS